MRNYIEIQFWKIAKWIIRKGYGCDCTVKDYNDVGFVPRGLNDQGRCGSCAASEVIDWIDNHIDLIKL